MTKLVFTLFVVIFFCFASIGFSASGSAGDTAKSEQTLDVPNLEQIEKIEIGVQTKQMRIYGRTFSNDEITVVINAGTATTKWAKGIPYDIEGEIGHITFNPPWKPTADMQKDQKKKRRKPLKAELPGSKNNPLGWLKFYFYYNGHNSNYGAHTTDKPNSVGKRVSHGCNRMSDNDALWMAKIILHQNGYDPDEIFKWAKNNTKKTKRFSLINRPKVIYMKK